MLPRAIASSGCCTLQPRSLVRPVRRAPLPLFSIVGVACTQRECDESTLRGPSPADRVSRTRHRLSNSLNISGIDHPRKFLSPLSGVASSVGRIPVVVWSLIYDLKNDSLSLSLSFLFLLSSLVTPPSLNLCSILKLASRVFLPIHRAKV